MMSDSSEKKSKTLLAALGAAAFAFAILMQAPASFAAKIFPLAAYGVAYSNIEGTVWRGVLSDVSVDDIYLGEVSYHLSPVSVVTLSPRVLLSSQGGAVNGNTVTRLGGGRRIEIVDADVDVHLSAFTRRGILGKPVEGIAQISVSKVVFDRSGCREAAGKLWTDVLNGPARQLQGDEFPMAGEVNCDGSDLLIALIGESDDGSAKLEMRVRPDFSYEITAAAQPVEDSVVSALKIFGFEDQNGMLVYGSAGVLIGAGI